MIKYLAVSVHLCIAVCAAAASANDFRVVAVTGMNVPGANGTTFSELGGPVVNALGRVAFKAKLTGPEVTGINEDGIWSEGVGPLSLVARTGSTAPGTSGAQLQNFIGNVAFNSTGQSAFRASLVGEDVTDANDRGIWSEGGGSLALVARTNDVAPGADGGVFTKPEYFFPPEPAYFGDAFGDPVLNELGETAFYANLPNLGVPNSFGNGIWVDRSGTLASVAQTRDKAAGIVDANITGVGPRPVLNASGEIAYGGGLSGDAVTAEDDSALWLHEGGMSSLLVRQGDAAPGIDNAVFSGMAQPVVNNAGQIAFYGLLTGTEIKATNDRVVYSNSDGPLAVVARSGDTAPGTNGATFDLQNGGMKISAAGETLFSSSLIGPNVEFENEFGMWVGDGGDIRLVARKGDLAPGTGSAKFNFLAPQAAVLNARGQVAFQSSLTGNGVTDTNRSGIWGEDLDGDLRLIVRTGDELEVAPSDLRTIESLGFGFSVGTGNEDGRPGGFNDRGQLAFRATFTDGSQGIFVTDMIAVPEPNTIASLMLVTVMPAFRRMRR